MGEFDERSLIGGDFRRMSALSSFGHIYRLSRLNSLTLRQSIDVLGVPARIKDHLRIHGTFPWAKMRAWHGGKYYAPKETTKSVKDFLPFDVLGSLQLDEEIRGCPECLRSGFHAVVHQLPWIDWCPWHGVLLRNRCQCGSVLLAGARTIKDYMLLRCPCGHDHFDRLAALESLTRWPEGEVLASLERVSKLAKARRSQGRVYWDRQLSLDHAVAALDGHLVPKRFVLANHVSSAEEDTEYDIRNLILTWAGASEPSLHFRLPVLRAQSADLRYFGRQLLEQVDHSTEGKSSQALDSLRCSVLPWTTRQLLPNSNREFDPVDNFEFIDRALRNTVTSYDVSHRGLATGELLIGVLIAQFDPRSPGHGGPFGIRLERALERMGHRARVLAQVLSTIAAQALMEQWTFLAWRAYCEESGPTMAPEGHQVVLLSEQSSAKVARIMPFPKFEGSLPGRTHNFRNPTVYRGRNSPGHYWSPPATESRVTR